MENIKEFLPNDLLSFTIWLLVFLWLTWKPIWSKYKNWPQKWNQSKIETKFFILLLILVSLAFYWYEWRPSEARKACSEVPFHKSVSKTIDSAQTGFILSGFMDAKKMEISKDLWEINYNNCLHKKGVKW